MQISMPAHAEETVGGFGEVNVNFGHIVLHFRAFMTGGIRFVWLESGNSPINTSTRLIKMLTSKCSVTQLSFVRRIVVFHSSAGIT